MLHRSALTGISSRPSAECLYRVPFRSSGASLSRASLISSLTSESQFSFRLRAQDVCWMKRLRRPTLYEEISGSCEVIESVIKYDPRDFDGSVRVF